MQCSHQTEECRLEMGMKPIFKGNSPSFSLLLLLGVNWPLDVHVFRVDKRPEARSIGPVDVLEENVLIYLKSCMILWSIP